MPSLLRKEAGLKVQLHRTSPRTHHMSSNFQTKQKLNQKDSLRKESGSKPQLHRTSPKTHHTSSNFHIKQKPNQGNSLGKVGMKTQPHRIIGPLGLLTLRDLMDCAPPQQDKPQETHLWQHFAWFWLDFHSFCIGNPGAKLEGHIDPILPTHIYIYICYRCQRPPSPPQRGQLPPPPLWVGVGG